MDFLRALEEAQKKGLTKEEFIDIWQTESRLRHQEDLTFLPGSVYGDRRNQSHYSDMQSLGSNESSLNQQQLNDLRQELCGHFQYVINQLVERQEQCWLQMQQRYDQMREEFRYHFEILSQLVRNIADSNTESMKLHIMQELMLLKQDLEKVLTDHRESNPEKSAEQTQPVHKPNSRSKPPSFVKLQNSHTRINYTDVGKQIDQLSQSSEQHTDSQHGMSESDFEQHIHENGMNTLHTVQNTEAARESKILSYANAVTMSKKHGVKNLTGASVYDGLQDLHLNDSNDGASLPLYNGSVEAKGPFAEIIASQMKQSHSSKANSLSSQNSGSTKKTKQQNPGKIVNPKPLIDRGQQLFTILNSDEFSISGKSFMSKCMYSSGVPCKVRVRVHIDSSGSLIVHVHLSKGVYDDKFLWPVRLSSTGYIYNKGSQKYTEIWELNSVPCEKPVSSDGEFVFKADVCLKTSRGKYQNINYQKLVDKEYAEDNCLQFMWELCAVENV